MGGKHSQQKIKKLKPVIHIMTSVSTGWIIWLCPQNMMFKLTDMMINAVNNVLPLGQADTRAQLVLFSRSWLPGDFKKSEYI